MLLPGLRLLPPHMAARLGQVEYQVNPSLRRRYANALDRAGRHLGCDWDLTTLDRGLAGYQVRWRCATVSSTASLTPGSPGSCASTAATILTPR